MQQDQPSSRAEPKSTSLCDCTARLSHPALERFTAIDVARRSNAAKACFIEPDRVCVNSGACEMRGF
jgi:hypothetical protein